MSIQKIRISCPKCGSIAEYEYSSDIFDRVFYDEPRFPGSTVYMCPDCSEVKSVGSGVIVDVFTGSEWESIKVKADDFSMYFVYNDEETDIRLLQDILGGKE